MKPALLLFALLAACASSGASAKGNISSDIFEDIPAPASANYQHRRAESFSYRTPSFRCGRFHFAYTGSQEEAAAFYRDTMAAPPYSWRLEQDINDQEGSTRLVFVKNEDQCTVDVDRVIPHHMQVDENVRILVRVNYLR